MEKVLLSTTCIIFSGNIAMAASNILFNEPPETVTDIRLHSKRRRNWLDSACHEIRRDQRA